MYDLIVRLKIIVQSQLPENGEHMLSCLERHVPDVNKPWLTSMLYDIVRMLVVCLLLLIICGQALSHHPAGYVEQGYAYYPERYGHRGYWWRGHDYYSRTYHQPAGYYQYGHYYQPQGYYVYTHQGTYQAPAYQPPALPAPTDKDWRTKLLELKKFEQDHRQYLEAVRELGLGQPAPGYLPDYAPGGHYYRGQYSYGSTGQTLYGYNKISDVYDSGGLAQLYQSANRLAENQQKLSGQMTADFAALVDKEGSHRARAAEILAKGQVLQEVLRALEGSGARTIEKVTLPSAQAQPLQAPQMPRAEDAGYAVLMAHFQRDCFACHGDSSKIKRQTPFVVADWPTYSTARKRSIWERVVTKDDDERMPRLPGGGAGPRVPAEIASLYLKH